MPFQHKFAIAFCALVGMWSFPNDAEAGPLLDWLRGRRTNHVTYRQARTLRQATPGTFTQAATHLQPGQCQRTCMQTYQRVVVNYVPYTAYRTNWARIPVTQYRPVTNQDPRTGCVVTCMRPCVNYSWQLQRTPYTTYRPVYRTQNYRVPVTTISNDCANGTCGIPALQNTSFQNVGAVAGACGTCGVPAINNGQFPAGTVQPGFIPSAGGSSTSPASQVPVIPDATRSSRRISYRRPLPENYNTYAGSRNSHFGYSNQLHGTPYGTPEYKPSPSGMVAPVPANQPQASPAGTQPTPADQIPMIQDDQQPTSTPNSVLQSESQQQPTSNTIQDPQPQKRWNLQAANGSGALVSLASNPAVVKPWGYQPVSSSNAFGNTESDWAETDELQPKDVNSEWDSF